MPMLHQTLVMYEKYSFTRAHLDVSLFAAVIYYKVVLLDNYSTDQFFDEMVSDKIDVRNHYRKVVKRFGEPVLRTKDGEVFITDNGNFTVDLSFESDDAAELSRQLKMITGVVDTGFFLGMASRVVVAFEDEVKEFTKV